MTMKQLLLFAALIFCSMNAFSQDLRLPLWPEGQIPHRVPSDEEEGHETDGILRISRVQVPDMEVYLPDPGKATGKAVVIFPGGGYHILAYHWEGTDFAKLLRDHGIAGIVVKYRLPVSRSVTNRSQVPLADAQRAMRVCRDHAAAWGIDPAQIGVLGFSAGGHLAASLSTQYDAKIQTNVNRLSNLRWKNAWACPLVRGQRANEHVVRHQIGRAHV